jgi:hypothetical protein
MQFLTAEQKQQHVNVYKDFLHVSADNATFLSRVITCDEIWLYA